MRRVCPDCRTAKPLEDFVRNARSPLGYGYYRKPCFNKRSRASRERRHGSSSNYLLKHRYGVDSSDVAWARLRQDDGCAICGTANPRHVDHDHDSKLVRGLLCFGCNRGLGYFEDNIEIMRAAVAYLRRTGRVSESTVPYRAHLSTRGLYAAVTELGLVAETPSA